MRAGLEMRSKDPRLCKQIEVLELLPISLINLISHTKKGPGLQSLARTQESQMPAALSHRTLLSSGTEMFSEQFF